MNVLTPTLGLGVGYSERYVQQSKCSNVSTTTLGGLRGLHGDGASSWSPQRAFIGVFGERAAWLMMTEHGPTLEGTTYRQ